MRSWAANTSASVGTSVVIRTGHPHNEGYRPGLSLPWATPQPAQFRAPKPFTISPPKASGREIMGPYGSRYMASSGQFLVQDARLGSGLAEAAALPARSPASAGARNRSRR